MFKLFFKLLKYFQHSNVKKCPFCGSVPIYDVKKELVKCPTLDCAIHSWYIHIDEWNKRK